VNAHTPPVELKNSAVAYGFFIFGFQYLYFRKPGVQILYWLTLGGVGLWWLADLFRIPEMTDAYNRRALAAPIPEAG
jgi:hypothetical protein